MSNCTVESTKVETSDGVKLHARLFKPREEIKGDLVVVLVHPYSILGGFQGLLKGIAAGLAEKGYRAVTFDMRGAGKSSGRASLTGFAEIKDVIAVCQYVCENLSVDRILLVGSSAGMIFLFVWQRISIDQVPFFGGRKSLMVVIFGSGRLLVWWYDGLIFRSMKWVLDFEAILLSYVL
jgi:pimeloyl-ACP methyl ester carboxylesterase